METTSFEKIRQEHPGMFLVLVDYEENEICPEKVEILGARYYHAYRTINEMYDAYRDLKRKGQKAVICTPDYRDRFIIERRPSMRVFG